MRRLAASYGALLAVGALAKWAPGVPYNVRELFGKGGAWAVAGFPIAVGVCFAPPVVMARWMARGEWLRTAALPGVIALHALLLWIVMSAGVPVEAIQDVVGAPVLRWPGDAETMARFVALASGLSALFVGGALFVGALSGPSPPRDRRALGRWAAPALVVLLVARFVVVDRAATDNLIELMAGGGSVASSLWLAVWILTLAVGGTALASMLRGRIGRRDGLVLVLAGLVVGWMALSLGTERAIEKYGRTFSAMQFLLSPDREHYAGTGALVARYAAAHAGIVLLAALAQLPFVGHRRPRNGERR